MFGICHFHSNSFGIFAEDETGNFQRRRLCARFILCTVSLRGYSMSRCDLRIACWILNIRSEITKSSWRSVAVFKTMRGTRHCGMNVEDIIKVNMRYWVAACTRYVRPEIFVLYGKTNNNKAPTMWVVSTHKFTLDLHSIRMILHNSSRLLMKLSSRLGVHWPWYGIWFIV